MGYSHDRHLHVLQGVTYEKSDCVRTLMSGFSTPTPPPTPSLPCPLCTSDMSRRSVAATRNGSPTSSTPPSHQLSCPALEGRAKLRQHSMLGWHRCSPTRSRSRTLPQCPTSDVSSALPSSVRLLPVCEAIGTACPQMQMTRPDLRLP